MKFRTKEEADIWKAIVKIRVAGLNKVADDIACADRVVEAFRERKS